MDSKMLSHEVLSDQPGENESKNLKRIPITAGETTKRCFRSVHYTHRSRSLKVKSLLRKTARKVNPPHVWSVAERSRWRRQQRTLMNAKCKLSGPSLSLKRRRMMRGEMKRETKSHLETILLITA